MFKTAEKAIKAYNLIRQNDRIVAAVSGGPDSMALLFFLGKIVKKYEAELLCVHVNHMIRGAEAERDADFVELYCRENSIEFLLFNENVPEISKALKISTEEAGRQARLKAYKDCLLYFRGTKIATGHNKNDNAETLLLRLARGTGTKGLSGISPESAINGIPIIRPLIRCSREQIEIFCAENNIPFITDSTNNESIYSRNKVRLYLMPWLKENMNPGIVDALASTSEILREQNEILEAIAKAGYAECLIHEDEHLSELNIPSLMKNDLPLRRLVMRLAIGRACGGLRDITYTHVEDVLGLLEKGTGKKICLPGGVTCETSYSRLIFRDSRQCVGFCYELEQDKPTYIEEKGVYITVSCNQLKLDNFKNLCTKIFKCDKILFKLYYRTRLPGDKIKLPGGTKKLNDFFIDRKMPVELRNRTALIADAGNILSVLEVCDSEHVKHGKHKIYIQFWEGTDGKNRGAYIV